MIMPAKRATVYFSPSLHRALKVKAARDGVTISSIIEYAAKILLAEEQIDLSAIKNRAKESERDFSSFEKDLKKHGLI
jgi:hypothetical protein